MVNKSYGRLGLSSSMNKRDVAQWSEIFSEGHTIRKSKKRPRQNTFPILLLNGAKMIEEHYWKQE